MKRILHVFANLNLGGAESRIMDVYRSIDKDKYQFDFLILTDESCYYEREILELGGRVHRVSHPTKGIYKHTKEVYSVLKSNKFTAVHSHTSYLSGLIVLIAWVCRVPHRISHARNQMIGKKKNIKSIFIIGRILCNLFSTSKMAISKDAGEFLFGRSSSFIIVPNSFDHRKVSFERKNKLLNLSTATINIVMVARLEPIKNHSFMINLIKEINESKRNKTKLYLVGSGSEEKRLKELVFRLNLINDVVFLGRRSDVHEILCEFDWLVLPSFSEGLGVAALEAQAAGVPCIVSEGVPQEADIGLGLLHRLPLDITQWSDTLSDPKDKPVVTKAAINNKFSEKGFSIPETSAIYFSKYGINS